MEMENDLAEGDGHGGPWPAFADLLAATTLLFLILFAAVAVPALREAGNSRARENTLRRLETELQSQVRDRRVNVLRVGDYLLVRIEGDATFPQARFELRDLQPEGKRILHGLGHLLVSDTAFIDQVQVVGHTSSEGNESRNWTLSASRAATIAQFLIDSVAVPPCRVSALGRSRYYPVDPERARSDTAVDPRDRRIELEIRPVLPTDTLQRARRERNCVDRRGGS
jgi:outer membrane protein OmpA-like peptidoglycan-associated protein